MKGMMTAWPFSWTCHFQERRTQYMDERGGEVQRVAADGDSLECRCGAGAPLQIIRCSRVAWPDHWLR